MSDGASFRSGFVSLVGRPNVGKSTLLNRLVGTKVSIVSDRPQTTRTEVRAVRTTPSDQIVFLDTPGIHKPRTLLGERCNERSLATLRHVDVVCFLLDASGAIGPGDRFIAEQLAPIETPTVLVVNKVDAASKPDVARRLAGAAELGEFDAFVPLSARTGDGVDALVAELVARLPEGPRYYPEDVVSDQPEAFLVAELVREKLLAVARDELPHSIAVTAEPLEPDDDDDDDDDDTEDARDPVLVYRVVVQVERDSQKGIVIGRRGAVLKQAGTEARLELEALLGARVYLDTVVRVERDWQRRVHALDRLGL
ncbi:MAG TPA: GTPase Era [Acidimicrobiia bacterium]